MGIRRPRQRQRSSPVPKVAVGVGILLFLYVTVSFFAGRRPTSGRHGPVTMYPPHGGDAAQFSLLQGKKFDGKAAVVSPGTRNHAVCADCICYNAGLRRVLSGEKNRPWLDRPCRWFVRSGRLKARTTLIAQWTPEDCAGACGRTQGCLWFAYCTSPSGCQGGHVTREVR